jgi:protein-tyrosine phosphatase
MSGFIDLHCHPLPGIDDGAKTADEGAELLARLKTAGFDRVVATPHVRSGYWENRPHTVAPARAALDDALARVVASGRAVPALDVAAEHLFDDVTWELFERGEAMPYPGGRAALVEFPYDDIPLRVEVRFWRLDRRGVRPVLAHPERYTPLHASVDRLRDLADAGARPLQDLMSLVGAYGSRVRDAADAMLREDLYAAACSDAHKPSDVERVIEAIDVLQRTVGNDGVRRLLISGPQELLGER